MDSTHRQHLIMASANMSRFRCSQRGFSFTDDSPAGLHSTAASSAHLLAPTCDISSDAAYKGKFEYTFHLLGAHSCHASQTRPLQHS